MTALPQARSQAKTQGSTQVGGVVGGGAAPESLLLDTYSGAAVAFSLRKLRTAYSGACIRVRRSSDNTEQDIGFVSNALDTAAIATFCGVGSGFVVTWYDQSGNTNNASQSTTTLQPTIYSSGAQVVKNVLPAVSFSSRYLDLASTIAGTADWFAFHVLCRNAGGSITIGLSSATTGEPATALLWNDGNFYVASSTRYAFVAENTTNQLLFSTAFVGTTLFAWKNSASQTLGAPVTITGSTFNRLGARFGMTTPNGSIQELVLYSSDQSANRTAIETNINGYWSVY